MKKWFKYFIYLSLIFLIVALIRADSFSLPRVLNQKNLCVSLGLLFIGFILDAVAWGQTLKVYGFSSVKHKDAIASMGLSVFGKYIPGKVWVLLGRSAYMAERNGITDTDSASISLNAQFISLWTGLVVGLGSLLMYQDFSIVLLSIGLLAVLSFLLFSGYTHRMFSFLIQKMFQKTIDISRLSSKQIMYVIPYFVSSWLVWSFGFYFLLMSIGMPEVSLVVGLNFSLAAVLGVATVFAPGGLGVREGVLVSLLVLGGVELQLASGVAILSRFWFMTGEVFLFLVGACLDRIKLQE